MEQGNARTLTRVRWRDGRLWLGVVLIIVSMVIGSRMLAHSDERVIVWRATHDLSVGSVPDALEPVPVALGEVGTRYAPANTEPVGVLTRPVAAGELLPSAALGAVQDSGMRIITMPVEPLHAPVGLLPGDRVDIWATPTDPSVPGVSRLIEESAVVAAISADSMGVGGEIGVAVRIPESRADALITAIRAGSVDLVAVPIQAQA